MSIALVAKQAGVSQATVSRVINRRPGVSPDATAAVRNAIGLLGYEPAPPERRPGRRVVAPGKERMGAVAVVLLDALYQHTPGVFTSHLRGIESEASEHGLGVLVVQADQADSVPAVLTNGQIEGLILMGSRAAPSVLKVLNRFTSIWLSSHHGPTGDAVLSGNHQISEMAAKYLLGRGHKHLAFLAVMGSYPAYPVRAEAFRFFGGLSGATVETFLDDIPAAADMEFPGVDVLRRRMGELVDRLVATKPRPTGLFVPNDMMTALCYVALRARGVIPGRDIDLISCNNEQSYLIGLDPQPATIDIGAEMIGRRSVEQLLRKIRRPDETRQVQIAIAPVLVPSSA